MKNDKSKKKTLNIVLLCISAVMVLVGIICLTVPEASNNPTEAIPPTIIFGIVGLYNLIRVILGRNSNANINPAYPAYQNAAPMNAPRFNFTSGVQKYLLIDEQNQVWCVPDGRNGQLINPRIHLYKDIISFELVTKEEQITKSKKGIGRAVVGNVLFGPVGAIVGSNTGKTKSTTHTAKSSLGIRITVNDMSHPTEYINLLWSSPGTDSKIMSLLTIMYNTAQEQKNTIHHPSQPQHTAPEQAPQSEINPDNYIREGNIIRRKDGKSITDADCAYLRQAGIDEAIKREKESPNPKFHRTEAEFEAGLEFEEKYGETSRALCSMFLEPAKKARETADPNVKLHLLNECVKQFEYAKQWHYNHSEGAKITFQDDWEYCHNSKNPCFSYIDPIKSQIQKLQDKVN